MRWCYFPTQMWKKTRLSTLLTLYWLRVPVGGELIARVFCVRIRFTRGRLYAHVASWTWYLQLNFVTKRFKVAISYTLLSKSYINFCCLWFLLNRRWLGRSGKYEQCTFEFNNAHVLLSTLLHCQWKFIKFTHTTAWARIIFTLQNFNTGPRWKRVAVTIIIIKLNSP